jgi:Helix-turn-helix domain
VRRAFKFRAYPTRPQETRAAQLLADHCDLYNAALEERREAWRMGQHPVSYGMQSGQLREIRGADPRGQGRHSFTAQQQTLRRLNTVFAAFCKRAQQGKAGYPRYKPYSRFHQVGFVAGDGAKWTPAGPEKWGRARGSWPPRLRRSPACNSGKNGRAVGRGTANGFVGSWPRSGARSGTGAATSTTRPPGRS